MNGELAFYVIGFLTVFTFMIILHELGHLIVLSSMGYKFKVILKRDIIVKTEYEKLNKWEYILVMFSGITAGLIPSLVYNSTTVLLIIWSIYFIGCKNDIFAILDVITKSK